MIDFGSKSGERVGRFFIGLFGIVAIGLGLRPMLMGNYSYENWYRGLVFAPVALLLGAVALLAAVLGGPLAALPSGKKHKRKH